jgi:flagellin
MAMRINHNIAALNALRNLNKTDEDMSQSLERLSSGQKINRAADGPAALVISEQMRGQIASVKQAIQNSEASISMVQTAEAALNEVNTLMISMRQLAIHAANEGANDSKMLQADQAEVENALDTIDRIARTSQFGTRTLLDGSNGANGVTVGEGLEFVSANPNTKSSPADGYPIRVTRPATRAETRGEREITLNDLQDADGGLKKDFSISITEGGKTVSFSLDNNGDAETVKKALEGLKRSPDQYDKSKVASDLRTVIAQVLQRKADQGGLNVQVFVEKSAILSDDPNSKLPTIVPKELLVVQHREFGSKPTFFVSSTAEKVLGKEKGAFERAAPGADVEGTIDGKIGVGDGQMLHGAEATATQGLAVRFNSTMIQEKRVPKEQAWYKLGLAKDAKDIDKIPDEDLARKLDFPTGSRIISKRMEGDEMVVKAEIPREKGEGFVHVSQNSLAFQVGPTRGQQVKVSLLDAKTDRLANGIKNDSGFKSLREINVTKSQGAQDALLLIDDSISSIASVRANLGAFQKNTLQSNTNSLRIAHENLSSAESSLRDADVAEEMSHFTRNQIMLSAGVAMLAQANQTPKTVLQLLNQQGA